MSGRHCFFTPIYYSTKSDVVVCKSFPVASARKKKIKTAVKNVVVFGMSEVIFQISWRNGINTLKSCSSSYPHFRLSKNDVEFQSELLILLSDRK